jgi:CheY-like chemotaxis protein
MKAPLRVLLVEDSEDGAHLLLRILERTDYQIVHQRVETAEALTSALDQQSCARRRKNRINLPV